MIKRVSDHYIVHESVGTVTVTQLLVYGLTDGLPILVSLVGFILLL